MNLGTTIKNICKERKISINSLEIATNIGRGNIGRWDVNVPSFDKVATVADYLGVSIDQLVGREAPHYANEKLGLLLSASESLRPEDLDLVVNMAQRLKESYKDE